MSKPKTGMFQAYPKTKIEYEVSYRFNDQTWFFARGGFKDIDEAAAYIKSGDQGVSYKIVEVTRKVVWSE